MSVVPRTSPIMCGAKSFVSIVRSRLLIGQRVWDKQANFEGVKQGLGISCHRMQQWGISKRSKWYLFLFLFVFTNSRSRKYTSQSAILFHNNQNCLSFLKWNCITIYYLPLFFSADMGWPPLWTLSKWESSSQFSTAACLRFEKYSLRAVIFKIMTQLMCSQKVKSLNMQTCCQGRRWKSVMAFKVRVNLFEFPCFLLLF